MTVKRYTIYATSTRLQDENGAWMLTDDVEPVIARLHDRARKAERERDAMRDDDAQRVEDIMEDAQAAIARTEGKA